MYIDCEAQPTTDVGRAGRIIRVVRSADAVQWDDTERAAFAALAQSGLIPRFDVDQSAGCVEVTQITLKTRPQ